MRKNLDWKCCIKGENDFFDAQVPGNAQADYAIAHNWGDVNFGDNCKAYKPLEDCGWIYRAEFEAKNKKGLWFVSEGIDYECDIYLNEKHLLHNIGLYKKIELDISELAEENNILEIHIQPVPKDKNGLADSRDEAAQTTKPAVSYGWDWHPRLIPSGMWQDAYLEMRGENFISCVDVTYVLDEALKNADVHFEVTGSANAVIKLYKPDGNIVYEGRKKDILLENIELWWCNGQGKPALYTYEVTAGENTVSGRIGFKKVELVMNEGAWDEPVDFPKSRSAPPMTICINNRRIFAKGSNWVAPEIFFGTLTKERYNGLLRLVQDANMNILRCWGGAVVGKEAFFDLCDEYGILVWQEFPLACNNYRSSEYYLNILEQEARSIIARLKKHACLAMWCGGNELFNRWSGMDDQSLALRLLNKLCYELDRDTPFIPTAPVMGMGHGPYLFYDYDIDKTVFEVCSESRCTAYSEFGIPSIANMEKIKEVIPAELLDNPMPGTPWQTHHGFYAWDAKGADTWLGFTMIEKFFGKGLSMEEFVKYSQLLQAEGLKFIFEEARRQKPYCSIAMNWCFAEPWIAVANQVIVSYPAEPKPAYYEIKNALRNVLPSLRMTKFVYAEGDTFSGELWLLNDSPEKAEAQVEVSLLYDGKEEKILTWNTGITEVNTNKKGHIIQFSVPECKNRIAAICLKSQYGSSTYSFLTTPKAAGADFHAMNG